MHQGQDLPRYSNLSERISAIHASHATFDLWPAKSDEIVEARDFAANLIGGKNVPPDTLAWVHERTGGCLFLAREDGLLTGVWASVLLSPAGVQACHEDRFDGLDPDPRHVAEKHDDPAGHYAWGIAGSTKASSRRVVGAADALFWTVLSHLPFFTRPATPAGVRLVVERLDFRPVPGSTTGIVWREPRTLRTSVAA
jgi:hypothetical protein